MKLDPKPRGEMSEGLVIVKLSGKPLQGVRLERGEEHQDDYCRLYPHEA